MRAFVATRSAPLPAPLGVRRRRTSVALWLPLTPLLLLLAPFALLAAPFAALLPRARMVGPFRLVWALGALLTSLSGTRIDVDTPGACVRLRII
ncbi:MAG TPA: hypothetical protein VGH03_12190 [Caulobacteraceae bacterium]|jgi:hypothetical protein